MNKPLIRILIPLLLAGSFFPGLVYGDPVRPQVRSIDFPGLSTIPSRDLLSIMATRSSGFLRKRRFIPEVLSNDLENLQRYLKDQGFHDAQVRIDAIEEIPGKNAVRIHIGVTEGLPVHVRHIRWEGIRAFDPAQAADCPGFAIGDRLIRDRIDAVARCLLERCAEEGHLDATVSPEVVLDPVARVADVTFAVVEGPAFRLAEIRWSGLRKTRLAVAEREIRIRRGELLRYSGIRESQDHLYRTGLFRSVFMKTVPPVGPALSHKDLSVQVEEKPYFEMDLSGGYGSEDKLRGAVEAVQNNFRGRAQRLGMRVQASNLNRSISSGFTEPWLMGTPVRLDLRVFGERRVEPGFDVETLGGHLELGRSLGRYDRILGRLRVENSHLRDIRIVQTGERNPRIRSISLSLIRDSRDNLMDPKEGSYGEWTNEWAGLFGSSNQEYYRTRVRGRHFWNLSRTVIAHSLEVGWVKGLSEDWIVSAAERFFTGGTDSVRGFDRHTLGPRDLNGFPTGGHALIVWTPVEVRPTIYRGIGAALFVDAGNVWWNLRDVRVQELRWSAGAGPRLRTPLGVVRVDWAFNLEPRPGEAPWKIHFDMGQAF